MTSPMTREQEIQTACLYILMSPESRGWMVDPEFYHTKKYMREQLEDDQEVPPPLIEIAQEDDGGGFQITVVDHDMTVHTI